MQDDYPNLKPTMLKHNLDKDEVLDMYKHYMRCMHLCVSTCRVECILKYEYVDIEEFYDKCDKTYQLENTKLEELWIETFDIITKKLLNLENLNSFNRLCDS
jgi:hypothetical protein